MKSKSEEVKLLDLIHNIRNSHPDMEWLFLKGQCYNLWRIVRTIFPSAECWYSQLEGHVYIKFEGKFYDIRGLHLKVPHDLILLNHKHGDRPHRWGKRDSRRLKETSILIDVKVMDDSSGITHDKSEPDKT